MEGKFRELVRFIDENAKRYPDYRLNYIHKKYLILVQTVQRNHHRWPNGFPGFAGCKS